MASPSQQVQPTMAERAGFVAFLVLLVGALMDLIDATIVNVALPTIRVDLAASETALEWIASGYLLTFAVTLITAGRAGDRWGRRRLFLGGVAGFGLASLAGGLAQAADQLVIARLVQGAAAGVMVPQVLATARTIFEERQRATAFAVYGAVAGLAVAGGLLLGGLLTDADLLGLGWRAVLLVNVPVAAAVLLAGVRLIPETRDPATPPLPLRSWALLTVGLVAIVGALLEGRALGWPAWLWAVLAAGVLALVLLVADERRPSRTGIALLPASLFSVRAFDVGAAIQLLFSASMAGFFFVLTIWLQAGEGFSPLTAGLTAVAFSAGTIVCAGLPERLVPRFGRLSLAVGGALLAAGGAGAGWAAAGSGDAVDALVLVPWLFVAGAGLALLVIPLANVAMSSIPASAAGTASGVLGTAQQLGGAVGIAILGHVFFAAAEASGLRAAFEATAPWAAIGFGACGILALAVPRAAVSAAYQHDGGR